MTAVATEIERGPSAACPLGEALAAGQFRLVYQPFASLATGSIVGCEALLRWDHPTRGEVGPAEFIPLAEETGAISELGEWVIGEACRQAASWRRRSPSLVVSVNVSPRQLIAGNVAEIVRRELALARLPASALMIEVTETPALAQLDRITPAVEALVRVGCAVAVDDFGTGATSLGMLRTLPVDFVKIDRSFVERLAQRFEDELIVSAVLSIARGMGIGVIAEGIETEAQRRTLAGLGCEIGQGFLFARPSTPDRIEIDQPISYTAPSLATSTSPPRKASRARLSDRSRSSSSEMWVRTSLPTPASRASLPASSALM